MREADLSGVGVESNRMPANMTGPPVLPVLPVTRVVHGISVAGRYGPVIRIGDPSLIPLYYTP